MPLWVPELPMFQWRYNSIASTRPTTTMGTAMTPGNNTKGSYVQVLSGANVARDVYGIEINFNSSIGVQRDAIVDVGVDSAGGSSYSILIPDLMASCAGYFTNGSADAGPGINYYFPLYIKSGSTVAVRASVNNSTVGTITCWMRIFGSPRNRRIIKVGNKVVSYGITSATSNGTAVTPGTSSDGAWTTLGTVGTNDYPWFWQYAMAINNATNNNYGYNADLSVGASGSEHIVTEQRFFQLDSTHQLFDDGASRAGYYQAAPRDLVRGRLQASNTPDSGITMAAWGVI